MVKLLIISLLLFQSITFSFEKLPQNYLVEVGSPQAETSIVEYFSLSCVSCLKLIREDFETIFQDHIQTGNVLWTFHPDPIDLTTLRFLICLENIPPDKRFPFFWEVINSVSPTQEKRNTLLIEELSAHYGHPVKNLADLSFVEKTKAFNAAFSYLRQDDIPDQVPAIEKNGKLQKGFPSLKKIKDLL